jgi:hypothetical protein
VTAPVVTPPTPTPTPAADPGSGTPVAPAPAERGWGKLLLGIAGFLFLPAVPQLRALLPVDQTMLLLVPAIAACALVGWWAGGRAYLAVAWVAAAVLITMGTPPTDGAFYNLTRGWGLLLAGAFGLICLFGSHRPLFSRSLTALLLTLALAFLMSLVGPLSPKGVGATVSNELAQRNAASMAKLDSVMASPEWKDLSAKMPQMSQVMAQLPAQTRKQLDGIAVWGARLFPALLALESLFALALAWATYHRLGRARLGAPMRPLREFRFNDQLVWGLIVGLTIMLLPTLAPVHRVGQNLLLFFGALYAVRGFGVLSWLMTPRRLAVTFAIGFAMLWWPVLNAIAVLLFLLLGVAALALGLGDTWADWRHRPRPTN